MKIVVTLFSLFFMATAFAAQFEIKKISGKVTINSKIATLASQIKEGDIVEAIGKKSFIFFKNDLGSNFLVKNGKMIIEKVSKSESVINLLQGKFFHYLNKKEKKGTFKLKTKNAVMGVRGTKYMVETSSQVDYLCVCEGAVSAKRKSQKEEYLLKKGDDIFLHVGSSKAEIKKSSALMYNAASEGFKLMGFPVE